MSTTIYAFLSAIILLTVPTRVFADLIFSAPPRGTEAQEKATFEPLAKAMGQWLGTKVVYEYPMDFVTYSLRTRAGRYDIQFDGPHFASWRMANTQHKVLVHLPGKLVFVMLARADDMTMKDLTSLAGKKVCGQQPPHLGTLQLFAQYDNPSREPVLKSFTGEDKVLEGLRTRVCDGAVLRDQTYLKMSEQERTKFKILFTSTPVPNNAITVGPKINAMQQAILMKELTDPRSAASAQAIFRQFGKNASSFERADPGAFAGLDRLLKEQSYGWVPTGK